MKKSKKISSLKTEEITPEQAVRFLEDIRLMASGVDEPTVAISVRIPQNILRSLKLRAKAEKTKYQTLMVEILRQGLREK